MPMSARAKRSATRPSSSILPTNSTRPVAYSHRSRSMTGDNVVLFASELNALLSRLTAQGLVDQVLTRIVKACDGIDEAETVCRAAELLLEERRHQRNPH